jgi:hypothetical protein
MEKTKMVSNKKLREEFLRRRESPSEVAFLAGMIRRDGRGDERALKRALGLPSTSLSPQRQLHESTALRIAKALGLDPVDIGL